MDIDAGIYVFSLFGVMVAAASGALEAGRKRFDWVGVTVIALVTSLGGGTTRDVLLGRHPLFWMRDTNYVLVSLIATAIILVYTRFWAPPNRLLLIADALALALFSITGAEVAAQFHSSILVIVLMGAITGSAGGVVRDVLCRQVPMLFQQSELYATTSVAGILVYVVMQRYLHIPHLVSSFSGVFVVAALRFAAILWGIQLPVFRVADEDVSAE